MYADITKITPPTTMAELIALDLQREIPYLKARCNRMGIHVPGPNPQPAEIIPHIQSRLAAHMTSPAKNCGPNSGDYNHWKLIRESLDEFIDYLNSLEASRLAAAAKPQRHETEPKADQKRTETEPTSQPPAPQSSQANQNRTETEPTPDQIRHDSEPPAQNTPKKPETTQNDSPKIDPPRIDRAAIAAHIKKLSLTQLVQFAVEHEFLPDPHKADFKTYSDAFFDLVGPPRQRRLDNLPDDEKYFILGLLEDYSLKKVQDKLLLPVPHGPYIATSKSALRRFRMREHAREAKRNQRALRKQIIALKDTADADFPAASEKLLKLRLVESSLNPDPDLAQTKTLVEILEKIHAGKLAERKLQLAESKT